MSRVLPIEFELIASCDSKYRGASTSEGVGLRGDSNSPSRARDRSHDRGSAESPRRAYNDDDDGACIIEERRSMSIVGWSARGRCVSALTTSTTRPLVRAVSTRRCARGLRAGARAPAHVGGYFSRHFYPAASPSLALPCPARRPLCVTCALRVVSLLPFPLPPRFRATSAIISLAPRPISLSRAPRRSRCRPSPKRKTRRGSSNIAPGSPPPARRICHLCHPVITVISINVTVKKVIGMFTPDTQSQ